VDREFVAWLVRYGAPLLFFAQVFGIFGLPIPDELLLTIAGGLVASGRLGLSSTVAAAVGGCLTGITLSYAVGPGWVRQCCRRGSRVITTRSSERRTGFGDLAAGC
jgi:membrane protein DedA with SNARE-associated domain